MVLLSFWMKSWREKKAGWFVQAEEEADIASGLGLSIWFLFCKIIAFCKISALSSHFGSGDAVEETQR